MTRQLHTATPTTELQLARLALDLGAAATGGPLAPAEEALAVQAAALVPSALAVVRSARESILAGGDPLGEAFCRLRSPVERRALGAFYTPPALVAPMVDWALGQSPDRLVDAGCGSGRFAAAAVRRRPSLAVVAIDRDPLATLLARATLAILDAPRATVLQADYLTLELPRIAGRTAFIGNPPYVRHHGLEPALKAWAARVGRRLGYPVAGLAGLHAYFYLATALHAVPEDVGCFVTSAEWLDVNYGALVRSLLLGPLGVRSLHVVNPRSVAFEAAMTTAAIACFEVGSVPRSIRVRQVHAVAGLRDLRAGRPVRRDALAMAGRWSPCLHGTGRPSRHKQDLVPLGSIVRAHRGVATGANSFFVLTRERARLLGVERWCRPAITSAAEILDSGGVVEDHPDRKMLLMVPADIDRAAHSELDAYLRSGEQGNAGAMPIAERYLPSHRRPWWYLGPPSAPPIVASYMARRPLVFATNPDRLVLINIAHGLYPRGPMTDEQLTTLVSGLNRARDTFRGNGRTYHGGLEKFEPRELERLAVAPLQA